VLQVVPVLLVLLRSLVGLVEVERVDQGVGRCSLIDLFLRVGFVLGGGGVLPSMVLL